LLLKVLAGMDNRRAAPLFMALQQAVSPISPGQKTPLQAVEDGNTMKRKLFKGRF
jgi:hypothetical protein